MDGSCSIKNLKFFSVQKKSSFFLSTLMGFTYVSTNNLVSFILSFSKRNFFLVIFHTLMDNISIIPTYTSMLHPISHLNLLHPYMSTIDRILPYPYDEIFRPLILDMPMKLGLKLMASVCSHRMDTEREFLNHIIIQGIITIILNMMRN